MEIFHRKKITKEQVILVLLFAITAVITLIPFWSVGFTSSDDIEYYVTRMRGIGYWWQDAEIYATYARRFYFLITKPLYLIPYLVDNFYYTKAVQYGTLLFLYVLFSFFIYKVFKSKRLCFLVFLLLLINTTITTNYNFFPIISWPFYFSFSMILCLISILMFFKYSESGRYRYVIFSAILFFITLLFYETYLVFLFFFCIYIFVRNIRKYSIKSVWQQKNLYKELLPYIFFAILYVVFYFSWRIYIEGASTLESYYDGSSFAVNFSWKNFWYVLWQLTSICFPGQFCMQNRDFLGVDTLMSDGILKNLRFIFEHSEPMVLINAVLNVLLFCFIVKYIKLEQIKKKPFLLSIPIIFIISLFSHFLLGISEKFNSGICFSWLSSYVTSFFSYFGVMLIVSICILLLPMLFSRWKIVSRIIYVFLAIFIFFNSLIVGFSNQRIGLEWARNHNKFRIMDYIVEHNCFDIVEDNSIIYYTDVELRKFRLDINYMKVKLNKDYLWTTVDHDLCTFVNDYPELPVYCIFVQEASESKDVILSISKIDKNKTDMKNLNVNCMVAIKSKIFYYSPVKAFTLMYESYEDNRTIFNDKCFFWSYIGMNAVQVESNDGDDITELSVEGSFNPRSICVSNMTSVTDRKVMTYLDTPTINEMKQKICAEKQNVDSIINSDVSLSYLSAMTLEEKINLAALLHCNKEYVISKYINEIYHSEEWLNNIRQKAKERNVSEMDAAIHDAIWLYDEYDSKKIREQETKHMDMSNENNQ